ncbi:hypothetical protein FA95DRAFT_1226350 [Auriscalpium vulgare]|uniref:Uncharacterized protein n=1 Tax=Auriscalpium vulgare TaxID=40419 RepID=A0ACB8RU55_9AGAM|nr:hypothetical protein FA95DRAFT_1226350 [Auriscalpium vulgare]
MSSPPSRPLIAAPPTRILALDNSDRSPPQSLLDAASGGFMTVAKFSIDGVPLLLTDDHLATGDAAGNVWIYNTDGRSLYALRDHATSQANETVHVALLNNLILVFGPKSIKSYNLRSPMASSTVDSEDCETLDPDTVHEWYWPPDRITSFTVAPLVHAHALPGAYQCRRPTFNLVLKTGSHIIGPINMLFHFTLAPDPSTDTYAFPPLMQQSSSHFASGANMSRTSEIKIGGYGMTLWVDAPVDAARLGAQRVLANMLQLREGADGSRGRASTLGAFDTSVVDHVAVDEAAGCMAIAWKDGAVGLWEY